jgi:hypothetical protein
MIGKLLADRDAAMAATASMQLEEATIIERNVVYLDLVRRP